MSDRHHGPPVGAEPLPLATAGFGGSGIDPGGLDRAIQVLRRRKWWVIVSVVFITLLVASLTSQQQKMYTAGASLLFREAPSSVLNQSGVIDPARQGATNSSLVALPDVARRAAASVRQRISAGEIAGSIRIPEVADSDLVSVEAVSASPDRAAQIANLYAQAFVDFRADLERRVIRDAREGIQRQLSAIAPAQRDTPNAQSLQSMLGQLNLAQASAATGVQVVERAEVPGGPSSPNVRRNIIIAIFFGLTLGVALAFLRDRTDQSLRTTEELEAIYGVPLLASIARSRSRSTNGAGPEPDVDLESFRTLRANLRYFGVAREMRSILVSSPMIGEGKSTVAMNLASTMAEMGDNVVLVEADLHKPSRFSERLRNPRIGLSTVLSGGALEKNLARMASAESSGRHLTVLPPGPVPPNASELLESSRMLALLDQLEEQFDMVIIDSPALLVVSDMRALVSRVSGVLIVSAVDHTRRSDAEDFRREIELLGGHTLGFVANLVAASRYGHEYYRGT